MIRTVINFFIFTTFVVSFFSCDQHMHYDQYWPMAKEEWQKDSIKTFKFEITDSLAIYNMYINIRNTGKYPYSNLITLVETQMPGNKSIQDTLNCILAEESGKWIGSGFGSIWNNKIPYKIKVRFPRKGPYEIKLKHGMRKEKLPGITNIGIRIEKSH